jgi:hypothetical protein
LTYRGKYKSVHGSKIWLHNLHRRVFGRVVKALEYVPTYDARLNLSTNKLHSSSKA